LQSSTHIFIHHFQLSNLTNEYYLVSKQFSKLVNISNSDTSFYKESSNYIKAINYTKNLINEKINNFNLVKRTKRGLINGLGSIIKQISGNLDYNDGEHFESLISEIQNTQNDLRKQLNKQYSINSEISLNFNRTVSDLQQNDFLLNTRIERLDALFKERKDMQNILLFKDAFNQILHPLNTILTVLQDIENSLTFCKLEIVHPSIITSHELFSELQRISPYYQNQLPFQISLEQIYNYESIIKSKCFVKNNQIIYVLLMPLFDTKLYIPIPTKSFFSIIPSTKFALKSETELLPLTDMCAHINNAYHCDKKHLSLVNVTCEKNVLFNNNFSSCRKIKLHVEENNVEFIPAINQYLGIFPNEEVIKENCHNSWSTTTQKGIFLFDDSCTTYIQNRLLIFNDTTAGHAIKLENTIFKFEEQSDNDIPQIKLHQVQLHHLDNIQLQPRVEQGHTHPLQISSTAVLYFIIFGTAATLIARWYQRKQSSSRQLQPVPQHPLEEVKF